MASSLLLTRLIRSQVAAHHHTHTLPFFFSIYYEPTSHVQHHKLPYFLGEQIYFKGCLHCFCLCVAFF